MGAEQSDRCLRPEHRREADRHGIPLPRRPIVSGVACPDVDDALPAEVDAGGAPTTEGRNLLAEHVGDRFEPSVVLAVNDDVVFGQSVVQESNPRLI